MQCALVCLSKSCIALPCVVFFIAPGSSWLLSTLGYLKLIIYYSLWPHLMLAASRYPQLHHYCHYFLSGNELGLWLARVSVWPWMREIWLAQRQQASARALCRRAVLRTPILQTRAHLQRHTHTSVAHPVLPVCDKAAVWSYLFHNKLLAAGEGQTWRQRNQSTTRTQNADSFSSEGNASIHRRSSGLGGKYKVWMWLMSY